MILKPTLSPITELQNQFELLQKEYNYEKEAYKKQTEQVGIWKKNNRDFVGILSLPKKVILIH